MTPHEMRIAVSKILRECVKDTKSGFSNGIVWAAWSLGNLYEKSPIGTCSIALNAMDTLNNIRRKYDNLRAAC